MLFFLSFFHSFFLFSYYHSLFVRLFLSFIFYLSFFWHFWTRWLCFVFLFAFFANFQLYFAIEPVLILHIFPKHTHTHFCSLSFLLSHTRKALTATLWIFMWINSPAFYGPSTILSECLIYRERWTDSTYELKVSLMTELKQHFYKTILLN